MFSADLLSSSLTLTWSPSLVDVFPSSLGVRNGRGVSDKGVTFSAATLTILDLVLTPPECATLAMDGYGTMEPCMH